MKLKTIKYLIYTLILTFISFSCFGQKQNTQWRFGNGGGINFNTNPPSNIAGAVITTSEGSASVADRNTGALLFYTDGVTVWNANNQVMTNGTGLLGGTSTLLSSTTAAVIIPKPGSSNLYYLVTIDEQSSNNGVRYSVVDMSLNAGLGDIVAGQKNVLLFQTTSEKLEVIPAADGVSYWLITHDNPGNSFYSFRVTSSGFQTTPVISSQGSQQSNGAGHMKINRQYNKIALGNTTLGSGSVTTIELFDFDNSTGVISNPTILNFNFGVGSIYGIEFSPSGKILYVSDLQTRLIQYDLTQPTALAIENSAYQVSTGMQATLQLGIDDKIYVNAGSINIINCPNKLGADCVYQQNAIANQTGGGGYGLPKWVYYQNDTSSPTFNSIIFSDSCFGNTTQFSVKNTRGINNIDWLFGDPNSGVNNTRVGLSVSHSFSQVGSYNVRAIITNNCGFDTLFLNALSIINCNNPSTTITGIKISGDTCDANKSIALQATGGVSSSPYFFWNFGDPLSGSNDTITITGLSPSPFPNHTFSKPGIYNVCVSFQEPGQPVSTVCRTIKIGLCCSGIISSKDSCLQNSIPFSIISGATINSVAWNFNDPVSGANNSSTYFTPTHVFSSIGNYNINATVTATCGSFQLNYPCKVVNCSSNCIGNIVSVDSCLNTVTSFQVITNNTINSVTWNFGDPSSGAYNTATSSTPTHLFSATGTYNVTAIANFNCGSDTLEKKVNITLCNSTPPSNCELEIPNTFSPNADGINDFIYPKINFNCIIDRYEFLIFNRYGQLVFNTINKNLKWDGKYQNVDCPVATYYYILNYNFYNQTKMNTKSGYILLLR